MLQRPLPDDAEDLGRWLAQEGITAIDGRGHYITNFGAIAAARKLDDFPSLERKRIRLVRYRDTNKVDTIDEQLGQRGYAVAFESLIGHLRQVLPHSEVIKQSLRTETAVYPEIALRARFKLHDKQRNTITNLISDAVDASRIKRKDAHSGKKFGEYIPYWA